MKEYEKCKKLNLGAGYGWKKEGWASLDHSKSNGFLKPINQAWDLPYDDEQFEIIFSSHMIEHISHFKIEETICEINRVMKKGGILRLLTPDLRKLATAYVNNDVDSMKRYMGDGGMMIKKDLGFGHVFMNFLVSEGLDNKILSSDYSEVIAGYAHVYCYDYEMISKILSHYGFENIKECTIDESGIEDHKELRLNPYDKDASFSLIIECKKKEYIPFLHGKALLYGGVYKNDALAPPKHSPLWLCFKMVGLINNISKYIRQKKKDKKSNHVGEKK